MFQLTATTPWWSGFYPPFDLYHFQQTDGNKQDKQNTRKRRTASMLRPLVYPKNLKSLVKRSKLDFATIRRSGKVSSLFFIAFFRYPLILISHLVVLRQDTCDFSLRAGRKASTLIATARLWEVSSQVYSSFVLRHQASKCI